jgi:hypothetical protein
MTAQAAFFGVRPRTGPDPEASYAVIGRPEYLAWIKATVR